MIHIREATEHDMAAITDIFNDAVENTLAIWMEQKVDEAERHNWWRKRCEQNFPVLVADEGGECLGYASFGTFRGYEGYRHSAELSIYVKKSARGKGVGKLLMQALIEKAQNRKIHALIGAIEANNLASIKLHQQFGFVETARMPEVGIKRGKWLDLVFMQKILP